jgi:hypothetical protein
LGLREVSEFWSGDRFAWDEIEAVGLVGDRDLIGTTPLGLVWIRPTPAAAPALGLAQIDGLQGVQPAIDSLGKKRGLLAAIEDSPTIFVQAHSESPPDIERITVTSPYTHAARLRFAYEGLGEEQSLRLGQYWTSQQESGSEFLVSSELPSVPNDELLLDGQFVFDVSDAACQVDNDRWLTIRSIPHTPEPSFWVRLERLTQFGHLESIDCWRIDGCNGFPIAIRSESSPTQEARASVACSRAGGDLSFYEVRMKLQISADAAERSNEEARQRFAVGQNVFLDTENLNWSSESRDFGSHELPLTSRPAEFPVLVCQDDGVQMSFDVFRSLAIRPLSGNRSELALGTRGGLHFYSIENGIAPTFGKPDRVVFLEDASGVDADATRVRVVDDTTWALFGERQQWVAFHGYSRVVTENSLIPPLEGDGKRVVFQPNGGVQIGTSLHTHSNDAWWLGRQPLGNLTDFYFDPICRELWISCEEEAALFRIVLDAF